MLSAFADSGEGTPTTRTAPCPGYGASISELSPAWHASWLGRIGNRWTFRLNRRGCISRDARSGVAASDLPGHKARRGSDSRRAALALKPSQPLLCQDLRLHGRAHCGDRLHTGVRRTRNGDSDQYWRCQPPSAAAKGQSGKLRCEPAIFLQARISLSGPAWHAAAQACEAGLRQEPRYDVASVGHWSLGDFL